MTVNYISFSSLQELERHTAENTTPQTLGALIRHEWPSKQLSLPYAIFPYFLLRDKMAIEDSGIMKGHKAVIPCFLQKDYISIMHRGISWCRSYKTESKGYSFLVHNDRKL